MRDVLPGVRASGVVAGPVVGRDPGGVGGRVDGPLGPDVATAAGTARDVTDGMSDRPLSRPTLVR